SRAGLHRHAHGVAQHQGHPHRAAVPAVDAGGARGPRTLARERRGPAGRVAGLRRARRGGLCDALDRGDIAGCVRRYRGAVRAALRNRIDGWYVLFTALLVLVWPFAAENMRRLLYPVVPLALLHVAELCALVMARVPPALRLAAGAGAAAAPILLMAPALA